MLFLLVSHFYGPNITCAHCLIQPMPAGLVTHIIQNPMGSPPASHHRSQAHHNTHFIVAIAAILITHMEEKDGNMANISEWSTLTQPTLVGSHYKSYRLPSSLLNLLDCFIKTVAPFLNILLSLCLSLVSLKCLTLHKTFQGIS